MTELFIDGVSVVLPAAVEIQVKRENPFFTKNGEYTYDIELALTNAVNARLYNHLHRLNSIKEVKTKHTVVRYQYSPPFGLYFLYGVKPM